MKLYFILIMLILLNMQVGCRKKKVEERNCGCGSKNIDYTVNNYTGILSYYSYKQRWIVSYKYAPNTIDNFFVCNLNQDSVKAIISSLNMSSSTLVTFSGKATQVCPNEDNGITSGIVNFYYISIDAIKRN